MGVSISKGNSKMGSIPSVSLPAVKTCRHDCECVDKCYAFKLERFRKTVHNAYENNYDILKTQPNTYWREVEASIMTSRFFRFHVSGDIPDGEYFSRMIEIAERNPHCEVLCFTKRFDIVNHKLDEMVLAGKFLPANMHVVFSGWRGLEIDNPYDLPEAHVLFRDGVTTARPDAHACEGNCTECAVTTSGCWTLGRGEQVVFKEH